MFHAPTTETRKRSSDAGRSFRLPSAAEMGALRAQGTRQSQAASHLAQLQRTYGNQAILRMISNSKAANSLANTAPPIVHRVLSSPGKELSGETRAFFEPRFGQRFDQVRVHTDATAAESAKAVDAVAYTVGNNVVFNSGQYAPETERGKSLLAHELTHVVQQQPIGAGGTSARHSGLQIARQTAPSPCTPASICSGGAVTGSARDAEETGTRDEERARRRRGRMTPEHAVRTGHGGRATQLELFLEAQAPGRLANLQGIFIDMDISSEFDATTTDCAGWISESLPAGSPAPAGMAGATRPCTFVHAGLNQQALIFNTDPSVARIGRRSRERWRIETLQVLIHETEHPRFDTASPTRPVPSGITSPTCTRTRVLDELSEIAAVVSEFPTIFHAASAETNPGGPRHRQLAQWFDIAIQSGGENIKAAMRQMGCSCSCSEVGAFVRDTFNFTSASWTAQEINAFHTELNRPQWGISWPFPPSSTVTTP